MFTKNQREVTQRDLQISDIPERYWDSDIGKISNAFEYKKFLLKYQDDLKTFFDKGVGIYLFGGLGFGKTSCGACILKTAISHCCTCSFVISEEIKNISQNFGSSKKVFDDGERKINMLDRYLTVDFLMIDDLGLENPSENSKALVEKIVRTRYSSKKVTIISSNLIPDTIKSIYGKGLLSIMTESMLALKIEGHNWRKELSKDVYSLFE